jgi:hypothetical protein
MMAAIETPFGCLSRARTVSCLVPLRVEPEGAFARFGCLFARLLVRADLVLLEVLLGDILGSLSVVTAQAPRNGEEAGGAGSKSGQPARIGMATLTLRSQGKSSPFCQKNVPLCRRSTADLTVQSPTANFQYPKLMSGDWVRLAQRPGCILDCGPLPLTHDVMRYLLIA